MTTDQITMALLYVCVFVAAVTWQRMHGQLSKVRKRMVNAESRAVLLEIENQTLRQQVESERNVDRAKRGDYGHVYNGSYKEVRQSQKTGRWYAVREVEVNP